MRVVIAAGGTAGHINPALSIAQFLRRRNPEDDILFVGATGGLESELVPKAGFQLTTLKVHGLRRGFSPKDLFYNLKSGLSLFGSFREADKILAEFKPDVCVGTGGYASFPIIYRAAKRGIPTAIHESNALPGMTTRRLAPYVDRVMVSFEDSVSAFKQRDKVLHTGNPLREGMVFFRKADARLKLGIPEGKPLVVSFWGSLGAREMNKKMADFIALEAGKSEFRHVHATGSFGWKWMPELLRKKGIDLEKETEIDLREYINDMPVLMAAADLVICRAGAMTLSELCAAGKPSIIIPSPNVTDNHQEKNARALERRGAAEVIAERNCEGKLLYERTRALLQDPGKLSEMSKAALSMGVFDGVERICETVVKLAKD
jgi:UDP-N-acetylglucosamine--N-acetylmuramyl-(pentapeptide) pyrophosphoryl-undecaprenol N-acetylglucosamine transferase